MHLRTKLCWAKRNVHNGLVKLDIITKQRDGNKDRTMSNKLCVLICFWSVAEHLSGYSYRIITRMYKNMYILGLNVVFQSSFKYVEPNLTNLTTL